jgi:hypothetical protein
MCPNPPAIAGYHYKSCLERMPFISSSFPKERVEEFCACVGNKMAEYYGRAPSRSMGVQTNMEVQAQLDCNYNEIVEHQEVEYQKRKAKESNVLP